MSLNILPLHTPFIIVIKKVIGGKGKIQSYTKMIKFQMLLMLIFINSHFDIIYPDEKYKSIEKYVFDYNACHFIPRPREVKACFWPQILLKNKFWNLYETSIPKSSYMCPLIKSRTHSSVILQALL